MKDCSRDLTKIAEKMAYVGLCFLFLGILTTHPTYAQAEQAPEMHHDLSKLDIKKTRQILYVNEYLVFKTLYRFNNKSDKMFAASPSYGYEFFVPKNGALIRVELDGQIIKEITQGRSEQFHAIGWGLPPGQSFMTVVTAVVKKPNESIKVEDVAEYDAVTKMNLYWDVKGLTVKSKGITDQPKTDAMLMGKPGFHKVAIKYPAKQKSQFIRFSGGQPAKMEHPENGTGQQGANITSGAGPQGPNQQVADPKVYSNAGLSTWHSFALVTIFFLILIAIWYYRMERNEKMGKPRST